MEINTIIHGDCFKVCKTFKNMSVDLIIADIPYCISQDNNFKTMKDRTGRTGIDFGEWDLQFSIEKLNDFVPLLKNDASMIIFHSFEQYSQIKESLKLELKDRLIWHKTNPMPRNRDRRYISNIEMFSWWVNPKSKWTYNRQHGSYQSSIFSYPSESGGGFKRYHPTQKNLKLIKELISIHSNPGELVLDPFCGSGTTCIAAKELKRNYIGIEAEQKYYDISVTRVGETVEQLGLLEVVVDKNQLSVMK